MAGEMSTDITGLVAGLRGQEFIDAIRAVEVAARRRGAHVRCGGDDCTNPAIWIGMQRCQAPGAVVCEQHWQHQQQWMVLAAKLGQPYCRHCGDDTDASHIYVVPLLNDRSAEGEGQP